MRRNTMALTKSQMQKISIILGVILTFSGIYYVFLQHYFKPSVTPIVLASYVSLIVAGLLVIFQHKRPKIVVILAGFGIGLQALLSCVEGLAEEDIGTFVFSLFVAIIGFLTIFFTAIYAFGLRHYAGRIGYISIVIAIFNFWPILYELHSRVPFKKIFFEYSDSFVLLVGASLLAAFIILSGIGVQNPLRKLKYSERSVSNTFSTPHNSFILREDLSKIKDMNYETWDKVDEGYVERETFVTLYKKPTYARIILRKIEGLDYIKGYITSDTEVQPFPFTEFNAIQLCASNGNFDTCDSIRFYGFEGEFVEIVVKDEMPDDSKSLKSLVASMKKH